MKANDGAPGYPSYRKVDVALRSGSTVRIRPVVPEDIGDLQDLFERLSGESSRKRFHGMHHPSEEELRRFAEVDYRDRFGLVAETSIGDGPRIVALASYIRTGESKAEMAVVVDDPFHGKGLGSILIEHLTEAASEAGIEIFEAEILSGNHEMLEVLRALALPIESELSMGVIHVEFPTSPTSEAIEAFEAREAVAAAESVASFLKPRSVAVIGASRRRGTISGELFHNLLEVGFEGPVYPVNPNAAVVQSVPAYKSVVDVPGPVDLAVIAVPAPAVIQAANECAEKGVLAMLVISSGFAEVGGEGIEKESALLEVARTHGMRIVGPNCMGIINTDASVRLNATFAPEFPPPGRLAFSSQSGALGIAVIDRARVLGLGMSSFVSVGNKADISGNDLLQYWERDDSTDVILFYLESFGNPRKFARIARRVARTKPVIAVKSGRSESGARAAASHTGSIVAGDIAVDALFRQAGVIRTDTLEELFDVASLVSTQPLPGGKRVAILTNAGGLGILCADACEAAGLSVPTLEPSTTEALRAELPAEAGIGNPVDMIASASAEQYGRVLQLLCGDPNVDSVIVIFIPPLVTRAEDVAGALMDAAAEIDDKTLLACFLGVRGVHEALRRDGKVIPSYAFPEGAARALAKASAYGEWRAAPEGNVPVFEDVDRVSAAHLVAEALKGGEGWLDPAAVTALLDHYGIRSVGTRIATTPEEVAKVAADLGSPVAVKIASRKIVHKTDVGGVRLDLKTPEQAAAAAAEIVEGLQAQELDDQIDGFIVQEMVSGEGAEMFVGMTHDPSFGPLVACGAGGTLVELLRDVSVRITPLTEVDVDEMLRSLKTWPLFEGYRGRPPLNASGLEELLLRVSTMVEDLPQLVELDLNPVHVGPEACIVLDARMKLGAPPPPSPRGARTRRA
jgi:acetate---CoA ligase (ADP-forming)